MPRKPHFAANAAVPDDAQPAAIGPEDLERIAALQPRESLNWGGDATQVDIPIRVSGKGIAPCHGGLMRDARHTYTVYNINPKERHAPQVTHEETFYRLAGKTQWRRISVYQKNVPPGTSIRIGKTATFTLPFPKVPLPIAAERTAEMEAQLDALVKTRQQHYDQSCELSRVYFKHAQKPAWRRWMRNPLTPSPQQVRADYLQCEAAILETQKVIAQKIGEWLREIPVGQWATVGKHGHIVTPYLDYIGHDHVTITPQADNHYLVEDGYNGWSFLQEKVALFQEPGQPVVFLDREKYGTFIVHRRSADPSQVVFKQIPKNKAARIPAGEWLYMGRLPEDPTRFDNYLEKFAYGQIIPLLPQKAGKEA